MTGPFEATVNLLTESVPADEIVKTLNGLIKSNNGLWKSEKQAQFILRHVDSSQSDLAKRWARTVREYKPKEHLVYHAATSLGFARMRRDKVRYVSWFFLIDDQGVVLRARGEVNHAKGDRETEFSASAETNWKRPRNVSGLSFDLSGDKKRKEAERQRQIEKNKDVIDLIKKIPNWNKQDIFVDFIDKLKAGFTLTPRQMTTITNNLPSDDLELPEDPEKALSEFYDAVTKKLVPAWEKAYRKAGAPENGKEIKEVWKRFVKSNSFPKPEDHWVFDDLWQSMDAAYRGNLFRDTPGTAGVAGSVHFFVEMKQQIGSRRRTKKALSWVAVLPLYTSLAEKVTPYLIEREFFSR